MKKTFSKYYRFICYINKFKMIKYSLFYFQNEEFDNNYLIKK
jgi:hypothetical protein